MKLLAFAVYDALAKLYSNPIYLRSKGEAIRSFMEAANDPQNSVSKHPKDFTLFLIGDYDQETGDFSSLAAKEPLGCALEFKKHDLQGSRPKEVTS